MNKNENKNKYVEDEGAIRKPYKPLPQIKEDEKRKKENEELRKVFKGEKK